MKIAVIDDDALLLNTVGDLLTGADHEVELFDNAAVALSRLPQCNPDVIITDILMPDMDGFELIRAIRSTFPHLWIIAMSGGGQHVPAGFSLEASEAFGVDRTILKPLKRQTLLAALPTEQENGPHPAKAV